MSFFRRQPEDAPRAAASPLRVPDFRWLLAVSACSTVAGRALTLVVGYQVYELTKSVSPFKLVALIVNVLSGVLQFAFGFIPILGPIVAGVTAVVVSLTVSAKLEGSTITTSVYTDAAGNYYFPALPEGKYRVWAQAIGFERNMGSADLSASRRADFTLANAAKSPGTFLCGS